jgi:RNA-directed DNA polymerase
LKRLAVGLQDLAAHHNLALATQKAAQAKHHRPGVANFLANLDARLETLAHSILQGTAPTGQQRQFTVHDPKRRTITAACFADRVLHHAVLNLTEPRFEQALCASVYACRKGLGLHAAVAAVQRGLQRHAWVVQVDVDSYFPSINHGVLLALLARRFKGAGFLALLQRIVEAGMSTDMGMGPALQGVQPTVVPVEPGCGLPIGSLTSQHFANAYLGTADRLLLAHPGVVGHVRYMDDMVWFCTSRQAASDSLAALRQHLGAALHLRLKHSVVLRPAQQGLRFCGFRVRPGVVLAGPRKLARYRQAVVRLVAAQHAGATQPNMQRAHSGNLAALLPAQTLHWRRGLWWGVENVASQAPQ